VSVYRSHELMHYIVISHNDSAFEIPNNRLIQLYEPIQDHPGIIPHNKRFINIGL
jgi:hypothetical protein